MRSFITKELVLDEAKIIMKDYHCNYVFVEGESDRKFYQLMFDKDSVYFRQSSGWQNVVELILLSNSDGCDGIYGIIDRDYHALIKDSIVDIPNLILTDENDVELMLFFSPAFDKFIQLCGSDRKVTGVDQCREIISISTAEIGALRLISAQEALCLDFDGLGFKDFIDKSTLIIDKKRLVEKVCGRTRSKGIAVNVSTDYLVAQICNAIKTHHYKLLCNGHDALELISLSMMKRFASSDSNEYPPERIFQNLVMAYNQDHFRKSNIYKSYVALSRCKPERDMEGNGIAI